MSNIERLLKKAGYLPERVGQKHKYYRVDGKLYTISHGKHDDNRDRTKPLMHILRAKLQAKGQKDVEEVCHCS